VTPLGLIAQRSTTRQYRDAAVRQLDLARRYRDAGCPVIASKAQHIARRLIVAARGEEQA